ncbi:MAG TPA: DUF4982 domain-containing protein [Candidatus Fimadaptatus faecigallinarum]|uniref:DUF4982 domain-containing protein n=1 Tax=Candidatus Fimadaptatus faecigallinarum TaxID=2840814 RepID=A0A9D1LR41_9FIRM|nr:DUF4982 domain-containing protein [Candidatus Fimadaptatus faecigallinarum]
MKTGRIPLNTGWLFSLDADARAAQPDFDAAAFEPVTLPHDWQIRAARDPDMPGGATQGFYPRAGIGWYRYEFTPGSDWQGKTVRVHFDGVQRFATVYLNGHEIGGHMYGYVPFEVELTDGLAFDRVNVLAVKVDNSENPAPTCAVISDEQMRADVRSYAQAHGLAEAQLLREYSCGGDRWYSGAGIYRNVWLTVDEPICVLPRGLFITPNPATGEVRVRLMTENRTGAVANAVVSLNVTAPDGGACLSRGSFQEIAAGDGEIELAFTVPNPVRWDVDAPRLYELRARLSSAGKPLDEVASTFGFREARFDPECGFLLNGRVLKLYGADLHHDGGAFGAAVPQRVWERRLRTLKGMGCNAIRCSHNPQAEEFYDICDQLGLIVIDELYDKWAGSSLYYQRLFLHDWQDDLRRMIGRDYNHPSIVLWSMGNEVEIQYTEAFYAILGDMCALCRQLDPQRPVSSALIGYCLRDFNDRTPLEKRLAVGVRYGEIVDVFMGNYMEGFYDALRNAGLHRAFIGSEVFSYYRHEDLQVTNALARSPWRDVADKDYVAGGFVWAGIDYIGESLGWPCHGWTGCPVDSAGFMKLRAYHLMSQWTEQPVIRIGVYDESEPWDMANRMWGFPQMSGHWNYDCNGKMMHIAVMTNCDTVELYLNDDVKRVAHPDAPDRLAHFYVDYRPGTLRAVGLRDGQPVCEQVLRTSRRPERLNMRAVESRLSSGGDIAQLEIWLTDRFGQRYEQGTRQLRVSVDGAAELIKLDSGDFLATSEVADADRRTIRGHALAVVRSRGESGTAMVTAYVDGLAPASAEITVG